MRMFRQSQRSGSATVGAHLFLVIGLVLGLNLRDRLQRTVRMLNGEGALKYLSTRWGPSPLIYVVRLGFGRLMR